VRENHPKVKFADAGEGVVEGGDKGVELRKGGRERDERDREEEEEEEGGGKRTLEQESHRMKSPSGKCHFRLRKKMSRNYHSKVEN